MEDTDDIIDSTLSVVNNSITNFDNVLGHVPLYKNGHNIGSMISNFIDSIVDSIPLIK